MNILVTGATGFLGRHLVSHLKKQGHRVVGLSSQQCDLTKAGSLESLAEPFDQIYHLAVWTQAGDFCLKHPGEQWLINQQINTNVLDWWQRKQPQAKLIAMGTSCAYDPALPLVEEEYLNGIPIESLFSYAMTKRMLLAGLISLQKQYGLQYLYLIPSTLYGPDYHEVGKKQMHFIFDLVRKIIGGALRGEPVVLWGNGHQIRELIHVQDFIQAMTLLAKNEKNTWLNVGGGKGHSIREFAQILCELTGYDPNQIQYDLTRYVGATTKVIDIQKLQKLLPAFSPRPLREGLAEVVEWFLSKEKVLQ